MKLPVYSDELIAEASELHNLTSSISDGMRAMTARNFARQFATYGEEHPLPAQLIDAAGYARDFLSWQYDRAKKPDKPKWDNPDVVYDAYLFTVRKIWEHKMVQNQIQHPAARMVAAMTSIQREIRTKVHEGINHAAKHNTDLKALPQELREQIDSDVRELLDASARLLAGQIQTDLKTLGELVRRDLLENKTND